MTSTDITLRPARESDAAAIADIYNQSVLGSTATFDTVPQTVDARLEWLRAHGERHPVLVAEDPDSRVVGWGSLSKWSDRPAYDLTVEISIYIDETYTGRGLGMRFAEELLAAARALGHHSVVSRISAENAASIALSERLGFRLAGTLHEVGRKFDRWLDVVIYELLLDGPAQPAE